MSGGPLDVTLPELSVGPSVAGIDGSGGATTIPALPMQAAPQMSLGGFNPTIADAITQAIRNNPGLPPGFMEQTARIESQGNPNAYNRGSGASGLYQFIPSTADAYGLSNPFDPYASADAAAKLALDNQRLLRNRLGRDPSAGELYLAHQQGGPGAAKLLANPDAPVADVVPARNITSNGGNAGMSAGEYAGMWTGKFPGGGSTFGQGSTPGAANPGMSVGSTATQGGFGLGGIQAQGAPVAGQAGAPGVASLAAQPMTALGPTAASMMPGRRSDAAPASPYSQIGSLLQGVQGLQQGLGGAPGQQQGQQRQSGAGPSMGSPGGAPSPISLQQAKAMFDPSRFYQALRSAGVRV